MAMGLTVLAKEFYAVMLFKYPSLLIVPHDFLIFT